MHTRYVINVIEISGDFLIDRHVLKGLTYPKTINGGNILSNPKWFSVIIYQILFFCNTSMLLWLLFKKIFLIKINAVLYFGLLTISFFIILLGSLANSSIAYNNIAMHLKELSISPFTLIIMLALGFYQQYQAKWIQ